MSITLYNTLSRTKDLFEPIDPTNVRMYVCGPTVYDFAHIGNARPVIVFDVLFRLLRRQYGADHVTYVRNITDVDDKIIKRAAEQGIEIRELTEVTNKQFQTDMMALHCLAPTLQPRATEHITEMVDLIKTLIERGHAYKADGHVLFDVPSMASYGQLSNRSVEEMQAGARVEVASYKRDPMDFVLWKPAPDGEQGFESELGFGRPGWHIECSAMAKAHLGEVFDIHGGGVDLVFPHHENEVAQSCCAHGTDKMANFWMHNGFLQVEGEKMSKSLGNFITVNEVLKDWPGEVVRFAMLMTHYRQPINWTVAKLEEAATALSSFSARGHLDIEDVSPSEEVLNALNDDLNTPRAIAELHRLYQECVSNPIQGPEGPAAQLTASCKFLGIELGPHLNLNVVLRKRESLSDSQIETLIEVRLQARADKDWAEADRIRDELLDKGIVLKDGPEGTSWDVKA